MYHRVDDLATNSLYKLLKLLGSRVIGEAQCRWDPSFEGGMGREFQIWYIKD